MDYFDLADTSYRTQVFLSSGVWSKPPGISMVFIIAAGGGGGGAGGRAGALGSGRAGGGGGTGGNLSKICIPATFISDDLNITIGLGGAGGISNGTASNGGTTIVEVTKRT